MRDSARGHQRAATRYLWLMVVVLLSAAAFRVAALDAAPPGWRDDELIEFGMDQRIVQGWRPLFITEAEGHEPVYHYLHAGTIAAFGENIVGYRWLPFACGALSVALTYALARRMFGPRVGLVAAALMAVSFWPVLYARLGLRHIGLAPSMLGVFLLLWRNTAAQAADRGHRGARRALGGYVLAGVLLAGALMTYFAGRALPAIVLGFLLYLLVFHRAVLRRVWPGYLTSLAVAALLAAPMFVAIRNTPGAERRTEVVGGPLLAAMRGDLRPALDTTLGTLGMFTFAGDPESLYNIPHRPVFDWLTGLAFYLGALLCLIRLKHIEAGFALCWLIIGIAPAFVSLPAASFSHTIAAMPVMYVLTALGVVETGDWLTKRASQWRGAEALRVSPVHLVAVSVIALAAGLTLRDYFGAWAQDAFVRFQYHGPTRDIARWLDENPKVVDIAIGTHPNELQLDPVALELDLRREDVRARWFDPQTVRLRLPGGLLVLSPMQQPGPEVEALLAGSACETVRRRDEVVAFRACAADGSADADPPPRPHAEFGGWLELLGARMEPEAHPGQRLTFRLNWLMRRPYLGPALKTFVHILDPAGAIVAGDDRLDVALATLASGDEFDQFSTMTLPADLAPGLYPVEVGLYDPTTEARLLLPDGSDRVLLPSLQVTAP